VRIKLPARSSKKNQIREFMKTLKIGRITISVSHPEKIYFPEDKITKGDLVDYYYAIAPHMLPYMKDRPLTMQRFPDGIHGEAFFQKDASAYFPDWIKLLPVEKKEGGITHYVVCNNRATLVYLATQACITPHLWLSKIDKLRYPDRMIFDLDPPDNNFALAKSTALEIRALLAKLNVQSFLLTTGSKGLHVVVPLKRSSTNEEVKAFAQDIASILIKKNPDQLTLDMNKKYRVDHLFIDTLRNSYGATAVAPFAVRASPGAPVATPLAWHELSNKKLTSQTYTIKNIFGRLKKIEDPWADFDKEKYSVKTLLKMLKKIAG
jgi:bifunctional non-homologous end joining protein LigD